MRHNQKGFNLVEIVIASTLFSGMALAAMSSIHQMHYIQNQSSLKSNSLSVKNNLFFFLDHEEAWKKTLSANKSLGCIKKGDCRAPVTFDVKDTQGNSIYDSSKQKAGFTQEGTPCNSYPSAACPIKVNVTANIFCATCDPVQAEIRVGFEHHLKKVPLEKNNFRLIKDIPSFVDCANPILLYEMDTLIAGIPQPLSILGMPQRAGGTNISRDIVTQEAVCQILGCGTPISAAGRRFKSCKDNGLLMWNGTEFLRAGGCYNGGHHMYQITCNLP